MNRLHFYSGLFFAMASIALPLRGQAPAAKSDVVLKPSQILVKGSVFSDKCKIDDLTFMDVTKAAVEGTEEGPVPSTHQIDYDQPAFTVIYNIYPSAEEARKGFEESHKKVTDTALAQSTPIVQDDLGYSCFGWGVVGRNRTKTTLMHNFVMHLQDAFGQLSVDQSNEFFDKYAAHISKQAGPPKKVNAPMEQRVWTSNDGKTVKAKLLAVDKQNKTIALEMEDGRRLNGVPLSRFGKADQEFVEKSGMQ